MFYVLATVVLLAALVMVTRRSPLPAAFALVVCFIALAGLYAMLMAPLLAILQILVYAGAIMALVVFVIMLLNVRDEDLPPEPRMYLNVGIGLAVTAPLFWVFYQAIRRLPVRGVGPEVDPAFGSIESVGRHLFLHFTFPFEIVAVLLTVAVVGVVVLAKRRF